MIGMIMAQCPQCEYLEMADGSVYLKPGTHGELWRKAS